MHHKDRTLEARRNAAVDIEIRCELVDLSNAVLRTLAFQNAARRSNNFIVCNRAYSRELLGFGQLPEPVDKCTQNDTTKHRPGCTKQSRVKGDGRKIQQ
jgi:hypothetical protein